MKWKVGFFIFILFITACRNDKTNEELSIFKYNESSGIATLDPVFSKDQATIWGTLQLFNGLVQLDTALNIQPSIAKNWNISTDGLAYIFTLRDDVFFHDDELFENGALALLIVLFGIAAYLAMRFEWRFAVGSVIALFHDVFLTLGLVVFQTLITSSTLNVAVTGSDTV